MKNIWSGWRIWLEWYLWKLQIPWRSASCQEGCSPKSRPLERLDFTILELAHAVVKTDAVRHIYPPSKIYPRARGFLLEWGDTLMARGTNLRLDPFEYVDFVKTGLIGRVGQGLSLLYFQRQGYWYHSHYSEFLRQQGLKSQRKAKGPDFVLERRGNTKAFLEVKASSAKISPKKINEGCKQIEAGFQTVNSVQEGYVTAVHLRHFDDSRESEASVTVVCPPVPNYANQPPIGDDSVLRANFGTWLRAMGHLALARALLSPDSPEGNYEAPRMPFAQLNIAGRTFSFLHVIPFPLAPLMWWPFWEEDWRLWWREDWRLWWREVLYPLRRYGWPYLALGIDSENLHHLENAARQGKGLIRRELDVFEAWGIYEVEEVQGVASIFPDTTALAVFTSIEAFEQRVKPI